MPPTISRTKCYFYEHPNLMKPCLFASHRLPQLDDHNVLIEVKACGLSIPNEKVLKDLFSKKNKGQFSVGQDVSGIVREIGKLVTSLVPGDEVVGAIPLDYEVSGCSEYTVLNEYDVVKKNDEVTFVDAAGCIGDAVKAYTGLHYLGRFCCGESVLILDGASAFGSLCIQLAYHYGAKVFTTASTEDEKLYLKGLENMIDCLIDLSDKNTTLRSVCMQETAGLGIDIVIDQGVVQYPQNADIFHATHKSNLPTKHDLITCLAIGGRWVTSKGNLQLDPPNSRLLFMRCATVGFLFEQAWMLSSAQQGKYQHILADVLEKIASGVLRPNIHHTVSFDQVPDVLPGLGDLRVGKVVMTM